jgi:sulfur carrier protein
MEVVARVMNGEDHTVELPDGATYARLLDEIGENPEAAVVVVDGRPVPEDATVDAEEVEVMRTVSGGSGILSDTTAS